MGSSDGPSEEGIDHEKSDHSVWGSDTCNSNRSYNGKPKGVRVSRRHRTGYAPDTVVDRDLVISAYMQL